MVGFFRNLLIKLLRPALIGLPASALIFVFLASDCHAVSQTKQDIDELQRNVFILQSDIANLKAEVDKLPSGDAFTQVRQSQADLLTQIQDLLRQVQVLTGRFEESKYYTDKLLNDTSADMEVLKTRVDDATGGLTKSQADELLSRVDAIEKAMITLDDRIMALEKTSGNATPSSMAVEPQPKKEKTADEVYEEALAAFKSNQYEKSRKMMESFIDEYPDHKLAGNAQFWIADSYYVQKKYADAILAYEDLLQKYKGHDKVPAALLKQALAFIEMGDNKAAIGILKELTEKYADSEQAKTAKEKLKTLEGDKSEAPAPAQPAEPTGPPAKPKDID